MQELVKKIELTPTLYYAVAYVVDDSLCVAGLELAKETEYTVSFKLGNGWLNIPKDNIIGISNSAEHINKAKDKILKETREGFPALNSIENIDKGRVAFTKEGDLKFDLDLANMFAYIELNKEEE
jgi:hypothetical protein